MENIVCNPESLILVEDDEKWYSQAGFIMVECVTNLFNDEWSNQELYRINATLDLLKTKFSQELIQAIG